MFSGKSEELLRVLRREEIAGGRIVVFKPGIDSRFSETEIASRSGSRLAAYAVSSAAEMPPLAADFDVVGVDEAQFFDEGIVGVCVALADAGKRVFCAGLDMTYRREPFGSMHELLGRADYIEKLHAVCHSCGGAATLTQRLVDGKPASFAGETIVVGDTERYEARCRTCFQPGE
jgi:thymidine kinase